MQNIIEQVQETIPKVNNPEDKGRKAIITEIVFLLFYMYAKVSKLRHNENHTSQIW